MESVEISLRNPEGSLFDNLLRRRSPSKPEHSPAVIVRWACAKPTERGALPESVLLAWHKEMSEATFRDSLLDRYVFPYL